MIQASSVKRTTVTSRVPKSRVETPSGQTSKTNGDFNQKVAQKAYELYVARGYKNGHDVEDWIKAEKIVRGQL